VAAMIAAELEVDPHHLHTVLERHVRMAAERRRRRNANSLRARRQDPRGQRGRDGGACRQQPNFAAWEQNEPYTIALLIKGRSGGASTKHLYRSGTSSTGDHILFFTSGTTPNLRHQASGGGTVTLTSSLATVNNTNLVDDRRDLATRTPRVVRGRLLPCLQYSGGDQHQRLVRHLPLGFSTSQDFDGDIALIACFASSWTPAIVRRWHADPFGFLRPWGEVPALMGSAPPAMPPSTGMGVVTFPMGSFLDGPVSRVCRPRFTGRPQSRRSRPRSPPTPRAVLIQSIMPACRASCSRPSWHRFTA
jgi:hypothetical protein